MIFDNIKNAAQYYSFGERFQKALEFLSVTDVRLLENGTHEIDGKNIFAIISEYDTKPLQDGKWESHLKYYDVQYVSSGAEKIGYVYKNKMKLSQEYSVKNDFMLWETMGTNSENFLTVNEGGFLILGPDDVHMPSIMITEAAKVKKVMIKVLELGNQISNFLYGY